MTRHGLTKASALAGALLAFAQLALSAAQDSAKPDILLLIPDQMRGDCLSILKHPALRTPNLDQLARQGVLFRRAYSTVASCIPARYALLSGLHPQTSGVVGFAAKPFAAPPLPEVLAGAGYSTVLVGRNMHQVPASGTCGYQKSVLGSTYIDNDEYDQFLRQAAPETGGIRALIDKAGVTLNHWQATAWPLADELHPTAWVVAQSRKVVAESDARRPLFLTTSFYAPHSPLFPPKQFFDAYLKQKLPSIAHGDWEDWETLTPRGDAEGHRVLLEGEVLRNAQAGYFGLIEHIDTQIASLIADFKSRSEKAARPWVIVVTSDHGEMLGDHGFFRKCEPFEGASNIPFIVCASPDLGFKPGLRVMQPVCLEDIMPTLLALAGTQSPSKVDGVNLVPTLRGQNQVIRERLYFEHAPCYSKEQAYQALTDGTCKYIWRPLNGKEHLFDLTSDPREERDLSKVPTCQATLEEWRARLARHLANRPEGFSKDGKLIPGQKYLPLNQGTPGSDEDEP